LLILGYPRVSLHVHIQKKKNKSGSVSIQIRQRGKIGSHLIKTIGCSSNTGQIKRLVAEGRLEIARRQGQQAFHFEEFQEKELLKLFLDGIKDISLVGPELLLGKIYDEIGFNAIDEELFKHLVITRLVYPVSKLKTVDYLFKYKGIKISVDSVYRYLDKLKYQQMRQVQEISFQHTLQLFDGKLSIVFYDVTTLYFEASEEDDFRKIGYSKDGKHQQPQIVLGLLVSAGGYPIDYHLFEGNKYEGDTLLPVIEHFENKHKPENLIVVADAGLLSNKNIQLLIEKNYEYILGARIKNESNLIKSSILKLKLQDGASQSITKSNKQQLIISYSNKRAKKDAHNRKRGLAKLEKTLNAGKLSKQHINNKGYNKYLKMEGKITIAIDYEKYKEDAKWDGLKGYLTNTALTNEEIIKQYKQLWMIEKTFRISKTDLRIRPIYHRLQRRIEAHICIAFAACKIYKELERQLYAMKSTLSPEKVINILKTIYQITIKTPYSNTRHDRLIVKNEEQKHILKIFNLDF
jgi:transposase